MSLPHVAIVILRAIHSHLQSHESIAKSTLIELTGVHPETALKYLKLFVALGLLTVVGNGPSTAYVFADGRFKTMTADLFVAEAEARYQPGVKKDESEKGFKKKEAVQGALKPPPPPPPGGPDVAISKLTVPPGPRAEAWHKPDSDRLHVDLEDAPSYYVKLDPSFWLKVSTSDRTRLVGFIFQPFSKLRQRVGFGPLGVGGKPTTYDVLDLAAIGIVWEMIEGGHLKSPEGHRRFRAINEHLHALRSMIGRRELVCTDEESRKTLGL